MTLKIEQAATFIRARCDMQPRAAIILGSGLGDFADTLDDAVKIPTADIPHYPKSTVEGHRGFLVFGRHGGTPTLAVQGRTHFYEGYPIQEVAFIVRIMQALGIKALLVTNAAGGINLGFKPGDLMLITDHINFLFRNPLTGKNEYDGPRFPDMSDAYDRELSERVVQVALKRGIALRKGVLFVSSGPSYETAAEVRMIRQLGGDAASMSTVPEVITAAQAGIKVIGISCITNAGTGVTAQKLSHEEVTQTANLVKGRFLALVRGIIEEIFTES
jgi:purine-nucleoside phosphorylase